jgi:hypothetical protein
VHLLIRGSGMNMLNTSGGGCQEMNCRVQQLMYSCSHVKACRSAPMFSAIEDPQRFHFTTLWFGNDGCMTTFLAKDPTFGIWLDLKPPFSLLSKITVDGLVYYRNTTGIATPVPPPRPPREPTLNLPAIVGPLLLD